ncbi:Homoserine dehydrogenase [Streptococcus sp. DD13]|nr:Homoserine dehydrogenase [Streptococcus sp. DD13]
MVVKIGLMGFGTVASGLPFLLQENGEKISQLAQNEIEISKVLVRDEDEAERLLSAGHAFHFVTNVQEILEDPEIQIVVELMGRIEPARTYIENALKTGKHVVTANKDLLAVHGASLCALAEEKGLGLYYEAAVAGGIPVLRTLSQSLASDKVTRILGVLNGTSNFMLTKMVDEGWDYDVALETAQKLGYAESDPTNDVEGIDAAYKVVILSQFGFGQTLDFEQVHHAGISTITPLDVKVANDLGYVIKLVGDIQETPSGITAEVSPAFVPISHPLASVNGVMNAVFVESIGIGQSMYYGPGAGKEPTATSVMADIVKLVRNLTDGVAIQPFVEYKRETVLSDESDIISEYYISLETADESGKMLRLAEIFNTESVSFKQIIQESLDEQTARLVLITHQMNKNNLDACWIH